MSRQRVAKVLIWSALAACALTAAHTVSRGGRLHVTKRTSPDFERRPKSDALVDAAAAGDVAKMRRLLDAHVSPDADSSGDEGVSAISAAAGNGHLEAVKFLLDRGADVNDDDFWGGNALVGASVSGHVEVVRLLLEHGSDPRMEDDGATALDYASRQLLLPETSAPRQSYLQIVDMLESAGARPSVTANPFVWLRSLLP